ncbi:MAG: GIY-YIG nuclease family protein [Parcubacteria group bacterium]|nr:GIY-YIG nuclease family protein [Parcubacteria group bacterium]
MHSVYVLERNGGEWYIGYTDNLIRRIQEHRSAGVCKLIYYEAYLSSKQARDRERKLKYYGSAWRALKQRIIA